MTTETFLNFFAFAILALLWLVFAVALLFNRPALSQAWQSYRRLPLPVQLILWLLALPLVLGLWVWNTRWPAWLRLAIVLALAWVTLYTFFPRPPLP